MSWNAFYLKDACYHSDFGPHAIMLKKIFVKSLMEH